VPLPTRAIGEGAAGKRIKQQQFSASTTIYSKHNSKNTTKKHFPLPLTPTIINERQAEKFTWS